jgi:hypothetical protein
MKKGIWLLVLIAVGLAGYVAAGPYLTINAIRNAVKARDATALAAQVDFPSLRAGIKAQLDDGLLHGLRARAYDDPIASFGAGIAHTLIDGVVDNMVTPTGLGALMEGQKVWDRANGIAPVGAESADPAQAPQPLRDPSYRYESLSRFTATVRDQQNRPVVFVLTRDGLRWKLSDIRLPR